VRQRSEKVAPLRAYNPLWGQSEAGAHIAGHWQRGRRVRGRPGRGRPYSFKPLVSQSWRREMASSKIFKLQELTRRYRAAVYQITASWRRGRMPLAYLGDGIGMTVALDGHALFVDTRDLGITPHLIAEGVWEANVAHALRSFLRRGATVIEVGACMGFHSTAIAKAIGPEGRLQAYEANPDLFQLLTATITLNGYVNRTTLYYAAALDRCDTASFEFRADSIGGGNVLIDRARRADTTSIEVSTVRIDDATPGMRDVTLLRIDAEGSEPLVVKGALDTIARSPSIAIVMEWLVETMFERAKGSGPDELSDSLHRQGFGCFRISRYGGLESIPHRDVLKLKPCEVVFRRG
jgi:FkbM family methyltransferase